MTFANGNPFSPSQWEPFGGDSLRITLPNAVDTLVITASGTINGASCATTTAVQQVILTDAVDFVADTDLTLCLSDQSAPFSLDIDSLDIDVNADFFFQLRNNATGEFIEQLPFVSGGMAPMTGSGIPMTGSGTLASTFVTFPSAGEFSICLLYTSPSPRDRG